MNINKVKQSLKWYFNASESAMGLRSNFYVVLNGGDKASLPGAQHGALIGCLNNIRKHRLVHQALLTLTAHQVRQLNSLYVSEYQNKYPPIVKNCFGDKTGLVLCLFDDLIMLIELCTKFRHKDLSSIEEKLLNDLIKLTDITYTNLHKQLQYNSFLIKLDKIGKS